MKKITKYISFSKYPPCTKDITFWINKQFNPNYFFDLVRDEAGDIVESVKLIDEFVHPKSKQESKCFRIIYRSMERNLINSEIDDIQMRLRTRVEKELGVELR